MEVQNRILQISGFDKGSFPMRYLGVPLAPKKWSKLECAGVVNKITERITCWSARFLSYAGRMVLIQSVLQAMSAYWSTFFILPASISKEVDRRCRDFFGEPLKPNTRYLCWFGRRSALGKLKVGLTYVNAGLGI